ncbi:hypothetical protein CRENBAI_011967, partial [Crenichthys baileyi]
GGGDENLPSDLEAVLSPLLLEEMELAPAGPGSGRGAVDLFTFLSREAEKTLRRSAGLSVPQSAHDGSRLAIPCPGTGPLRRHSPPAPLAVHSGPAVTSPSSRRKKRRRGAPSYSAGEEVISLPADLKAAASKPASSPATALSPRLAAASMPASSPATALSPRLAAASMSASSPATALSPRLTAAPPMPSSLAPARCSEATPDELEQRLRFFARQIRGFRKTSLLYFSPELMERIRQMEEDYGTAVFIELLLSSPRQDSRELLLSSPRQDSRELLLSSPRQDSRELLLRSPRQDSRELLLSSPRQVHSLTPGQTHHSQDSRPDTPQPDSRPDTPQPDTPQPDTPQPDTPQPDTPQPDTPQPDTKSASTSSTRRRGRRKRGASAQFIVGLGDASAPAHVSEGPADASAPAHVSEGPADASAPAHVSEGPANALASAPSLQGFSGKLVLVLASEPCDKGFEEEEPPDHVFEGFKEQFVLVFASEPLDEGFQEEAPLDPVSGEFKEQLFLVLVTEAPQALLEPLRVCLAPLQPVRVCLAPLQPLRICLAPLQPLRVRLAPLQPPIVRQAPCLRSSTVFLGGPLLCLAGLLTNLQVPVAGRHGLYASVGLHTFVAGLHAFAVDCPELCVAGPGTHPNFVPARDDLLVAHLNFVPARDDLMVARLNFVPARDNLLVARPNFVPARDVLLIARPNFVFVSGQECHIQSL